MCLKRWRDLVIKKTMSEGRRIIIFYIMGISVNVDNVMKIIVISVKFY